MSRHYICLAYDLGYLLCTTYVGSSFSRKIGANFTEHSRFRPKSRPRSGRFETTAVDFCRPTANTIKNRAFRSQIGPLSRYSCFYLGSLHHSVRGRSLKIDRTDLDRGRSKSTRPRSTFRPKSTVVFSVKLISNK